MQFHAEPPCGSGGSALQLRDSAVANGRFTEPSRQGSYKTALEQEKRIYQDCIDVHRLPEIFHYWSNRHLRPKLLPYGLDSPNSMFRTYLEELCGNGRDRLMRFVSLGAGNCDLEIDIARHLCAQGKTGFTIECLDLNDAMLERGRISAARAGLDSQLRFVQGDLNAWNPEGEYDAALANQTLHHVVNLEGLFDQIRRSLRPNGLFIVSDMIGRNGHQRWPEALQMVREFWRTLPPSYRFNRRFGYYDERYEDWDCSVEGFEGVRAQDILPLLLDRFHFHLFIPFGNLIDPFIDRAFGHNFDAKAPWDRAFIDRVHQRDDQEIACGRLKPTHMLAVIGKYPGVAPVFPQNLSPRLCLRAPGTTNGVPASAICGSYEWRSWPHSPEQELATACQRLADAGRQIKQRTTWALRLQKELEERTTWALRLQNELEGLRKEMEERTAWALRLDQELEENAVRVLHLGLELQRQTSRAARLETELRQYLHNPFRFAIRLLAGIRNRLKRICGLGINRENHRKRW